MIVELGTATRADRGAQVRVAGGDHLAHGKAVDPVGHATVFPRDPRGWKRGWKTKWMPEIVPAKSD